MMRNQADSQDTRQSAAILLPLTSERETIPGFSGDTPKRHEVSIERSQLPLTIHFGDKTYILVVTKSNKLLLQKPF